MFFVLGFFLFLFVQDKFLRLVSCGYFGFALGLWAVELYPVYSTYKYTEAALLSLVFCLLSFGIKIVEENLLFAAFGMILCHVCSAISYSLHSIPIWFYSYPLFAFWTLILGYFAPDFTINGAITVTCVSALINMYYQDFDFSFSFKMEQNMKNFLLILTAILVLSVARLISVYSKNKVDEKNNKVIMV